MIDLFAVIAVVVEKLNVAVDSYDTLRVSSVCVVIVVVQCVVDDRLEVLIFDVVIEWTLWLDVVVTALVGRVDGGTGVVVTTYVFVVEVLGTRWRRRWWRTGRLAYHSAAAHVDTGVPRKHGCDSH